jgi:hypothetical protein
MVPINERTPSKPPVRIGWADAAKKIARLGDDALVMGEFGNQADAASSRFHPKY